MCQEGDNNFFGIATLITNMTWILLKQVQEIISGFGSKFTLVSGFGTMEIWRYGIWVYYLVTGLMRGSLGASFVSADWQVRVFWSSGIIYIPSDRLHIHTITLYGCMERRYR